MAVTADSVIVTMAAQNAQYNAEMNRSIAVAERMEKAEASRARASVVAAQQMLTEAKALGAKNKANIDVAKNALAAAKASEAQIKASNANSVAVRAETKAIAAKATSLFQSAVAAEKEANAVATAAAKTAAAERKKYTDMVAANEAAYTTMIRNARREATEENKLRTRAANEAIAQQKRIAEEAEASAKRQARAARQAAAEVAEAQRQANIPFFARNVNAQNLQSNPANIAAQLNDVGVTAAMGMSPLMIALQQGTQLTQAFAGQTVKQSIVGLGAAFAGIVNPVGLLTIGLVAGAAALIQWGIAAATSGEDAEEFEKKVEAIEKAMTALTQATAAISGTNISDNYSSAAADALRLLEIQRQIAEINAQMAIRGVMNSAAAQVGAITTTAQIAAAQAAYDAAAASRLPRTPSTMGIPSATQEEVLALEVQLGVLKNSAADAANKLAEMFNVPPAAAQQIQEMLGALRDAPDAAAQQQAAVDLLDYVSKVTQKLSLSTEEGQKLADQISAAALAAIQLNSIDTSGGLSAAALAAAALADKIEAAKSDMEALVEAANGAQLDRIGAKARRDAIMGGASEEDADIAGRVAEEAFRNRDALGSADPITRATARAALIRFEEELKNTQKLEAEITAEIERQEQAIKDATTAYEAAGEAVKSIKDDIENIAATNIGDRARFDALAGGATEGEADIEAKVAEARFRNRAAFGSQDAAIRAEANRQLAIYEAHLREAEKLAVKIAGQIQLTADEAERAAKALEDAASAMETITGLADSAQLSRIGSQAQLDALQGGATNDDAEIAGKLAEEAFRNRDALHSSEPAIRAAAEAEMARYEADLRAQAKLESEINKILEARKKAIKDLKDEQNEYKDAVKALLERIELLNEQTNALNGASYSLANYNRILERAKIIHDLTNAAVKEGVALTPEVTSAIEAQADAYIKAAEAEETAEDRMKRFADLSDQISNSLRSAFDNMFDDPIEGLKQLSEELALLAIKLAAMKAFPNIFGKDGMMDFGLPELGWRGQMAPPGGAGGVITPSGVAAPVVGVASSTSGATVLGTGATGDLPAGAEGLLNLIRRAEGTAGPNGYNTTLANGALLPGGQEQQLTSMTLRQILEMQRGMLAHPDNRWNSSAAGAYQIVGTTLGGEGLDGSGGLIKSMGLSLDQLFTPVLQDMMAQQLVAGRAGQGVTGLRNEWQGLMNVDTNAILAAQAQPTVMPATASTIQQLLTTLSTQAAGPAYAGGQGMGVGANIGSFLAQLGSLLLGGFDEGGYTGPGAVGKPAGVVHKGEVVFSQSDIARAGGVGSVEALRLGGRLPGYANGGLVGITPAMGGSSRRGRDVTFQMIDQRPAGSPDLNIDKSTTRGPTGDELVKIYVKEGFARGSFDSIVNRRLGTKTSKVVR